MSKQNRKSSNSKDRSSLILVLMSLLIVVVTVMVRFVTMSDTPNEGAQVPEADPNLPTSLLGYTDSTLEVYFFDVGQADSILLKTDDKVMLVDTGNAGDADTSFKTLNKINLSHELNRLGVDKIDILVATHPHEDHMGSMYKILKLFDVKELYANKILPENEWAKYYERFVNALEESDTHLISPTTLSNKQLIAKVDEYNNSLPEGEEDLRITFNEDDYFRAGDKINFGNATITFLGPNSEEYSDTNDYSIVMMIEFEDVKLMLTGDAGKKSEVEILAVAYQNKIDLSCDILKVAHHGSRTANTEDFIDAVKPKYAVIMVGKDNSYGLPDEDVLERLEKHGTTIYQTQDVGDIKLTINDGRYDFDLGFSHEEKGSE